MMSFSIEVDRELYENYFRIADLNGDGKIDGSEAVAFFSGSNLPHDVLAQIWSCADPHGRGFLDRLGFYKALKLVSVAQRNGHLMPENIKHALSATSKIPAPKISTVNINSWVASYEDSKEADTLKWPKLSQSDISKYTEIFRKMDRDKDGKITGEQARILFLSWEIPKVVLRKIWNLADCDRDGNLSHLEFCIAVYFMERLREGFSLPTSLPDTIRYDETLLKATSKDLEDEALELAIKASIQSAISERLPSYQHSASTGSTDTPNPAQTTIKEDGPGLHKFGANDMPPLSLSSTPSAPPLDNYFCTESFSEPGIHNFSTVRANSSQFEEGDSSNVSLGMCSICIEKPVEGACIPCGHMAGCMGCLQKIKELGGECPICRAKIVWVVKLYAV